MKPYAGHDRERRRRGDQQFFAQDRGAPRRGEGRWRIPLIIGRSLTTKARASRSASWSQRRVPRRSIRLTAARDSRWRRKWLQACGVDGIPPAPIAKRA